MRQMILILGLFSGLCSAAYGQDNDGVDAEGERFTFRIRNMNFIKNNEYSNPLVEGYTLTGYYLLPEIIYKPSDNFSLSLGTHMLHYSGSKRFPVFSPLLSASYHFAPGAEIIIGTLSGSDSHGMYDPHFNRERIYNKWFEEGLQLHFYGDHLFNDTWLSWENFIFRGDTVREIFTFGESLRYSSSLIGDLFTYELPVQIMLKHYGGQISDYPEPVETYFNLSAGAKIVFQPASGKYGNPGFEYLFFISDELTGKSVTGLSFGHAEWFRLSYEISNLQLEAGYWIAKNFYAPAGNPLFGSVSDYLDDAIIPERRIVTGTINYTLIPESFLQLYFGLDIYYDTRLRRVDNSIALHLRFDRLFSRGKKEKRVVSGEE